MVDWADEISNSLHTSMRFDSDTGEMSRERVAKALRKAKTDGIQEATSTICEKIQTRTNIINNEIGKL